MSMIRASLLLAAVCLSAAGPLPAINNTPIGNTTPSTGAFTTLSAAAGAVFPGSVYYAQNYGACTWDATHDVGPCVNAAITAASAVSNAKGEVVIPAGRFGLATTIRIGVSGVHLTGGGIGFARDTVSSANMLAATSFVWIGTAGGQMLDVEPAGTSSLYSTDVTGIVFDGASLADICVKFTQVSNSKLDVGAAECRMYNIWMTTEIASFDGPGNQSNEIWFRSRSTSATFSPTGILLDGALNSWNTSYNRIHLLSAWYAKGDGIVIADTDNNLIEDINTPADPTNNGGTPLTWANSAYTMKNGQVANGWARANAVLKAGVGGVVQGFQSGSTVTPGVATGSAALNTVTLVTNGTTAGNTKVLNFAATTGVVAGMVANCGGWFCGIAPNTPVTSVGATTVTMAADAVGSVAISTSVIFSYGIKQTAVTGTYTMTAVDGTHWNITAPAGGNSQSNVAIASGVVSFTDMVIPLTGTPNASDTFIIVVPTPTNNITIQNLDKDNQAPNPMVEPGARVFLTTTSNPYPAPIRSTGNIIMIPLQGSTNSATQIGGAPSDTTPGQFAAEIGGTGNATPGFGAATVGGNGLSNSGTYASARGDTNVVSGYTSEVGGSNSSDRARSITRCYGGGKFSVVGDNQFCESPINTSTTDATVTRITVLGNTPSTADTVNLANNSTYRVGLRCAAHQTGGSSGTQNDSASWTIVALYKRGANAAATSFVAGYYVNSSLANTAVVSGTGFAPTLSDAAANSWTITLAADTANGGPAISGTGQANKNIEWACRADTVEVVN